MTPILTSILFVLMCRASTVTLPSVTTTVGVGNKVKYNTVVDNPTGSGYDATKGIFTVPANGVYSLSVSMSGLTTTSHLTLRKNGVILVWLFTSKDYDMASQTINVNLASGDLIFVQMNSGSNLFNVYNTSSAAKVALTYTLGPKI